MLSRAVQFAHLEHRIPLSVLNFVSVTRGLNGTALSPNRFALSGPPLIFDRFAPVHAMDADMEDAINIVRPLTQQIPIRCAYCYLMV
jgi:hypothetical protein